MFTVLFPLFLEEVGRAHHELEVVSVFHVVIERYGKGGVYHEVAVDARSDAGREIEFCAHSAPVLAVQFENERKIVRFREIDAHVIIEFIVDVKPLVRNRRFRIAGRNVTEVYMNVSRSEFL